MAIKQIEYADKTFLRENADIPDINKVRDEDMNEIKEVVNNNAQILEGTIVESTNDYIKFSNGVMIQWKTISFSAIVTSQQVGSLYCHQLDLGNWATPFIGSPWICNATVGNMQVARILWAAAPSYVNNELKNPTATHCGTWNLLSPTNTNHWGYVNLLAVGRWK